MILTVTLNASIDKRYVVEGAAMGEVNRVKECTYTPGGKGLNVSKPASIAGAKVVATGFVGGHAGNYIVESLKPFGIESAFYHVDGESRSCINIWDTVNHVQTEYLEPGFTVSEADFAGFVEKFKEEIPRYMIKHQVRPGITGWAQVNGFRGDTSIRGRIEHDLYYIENWSLGLDIKILFLTFFKGFVNKNAY